MEPLTVRQQQVLDFISSCLDINACPPTLREISGHINTKGTVTAIRHLDELERKGYITRRAGSSRSITVMGRGGTIAVPVIGRIKAGLPSLAYEDTQGYISLDMNWVHDKGCFFLRVEGDSMIDAHILDGDLVLIRPQRTADNGEIVVAMIDGEATLKRLFRDDSHIRLQPENKSMEPIIIKAGDAETVIIGKLLKTIRNYP
jgi:repressor LexA